MGTSSLVSASQWEKCSEAGHYGPLGHALIGLSTAAALGCLSYNTLLSLQELLPRAKGFEHS